MALKSVFKAAAQTIFTALDDVKISVTYRVVSSSYNTSTGIVTPSNTDYAITNCIRIDYEADEIDGLAVKPEDFKLMIPVDDLDVNPAVDHQILIGTDIHNVVSYQKDPADAVWTIQIRK
jgi:hypothetical protein